MSELSYLEKLLDGVEVEWSNLGNLCDIFTGGEAPQKHIKGDTPTSDYQYPIYGNGAEIYGYADSYRIGQDAVTISSIGANTGTIYFRKAFFTPIIRLKVVIPKHSWLLPRYLFHYLSSQTINSKSSSVPNMNASDVKKLSIPIPCPNNPEKSLAIQSEIVRILDKFTALTAELTAELNMRKKQYNYYRDQLLSFDNEDVPHLPMGQKDIGEFIRGGTFQKKDFMDAGVGCIHYGQIYTYYGTYTKKTKTHISAALAKKCKKAQKGNLIIATTSENDEDVCKAVAWLGSDDIAVSSDACIYKHNLNPKYVSYYFQTEQFQNQKRQYITGAKVRRVN
ncbi:TPA: restriction endonuclease subunit S, partial [Escherichia coli]